MARAARVQERPVRLVLVTGASLQVRISQIGSDYVAGELDAPSSVAVIVPGRSIVCVDVDGLLGLGESDASDPPPRAHLRAMMTNMQCLSRRVVVHTVAGQWGGVINAVVTDAIVLTSSDSRQHLVMTEHIVWVAVCGD